MTSADSVVKKSSSVIPGGAHSSLPKNSLVILTVDPYICKLNTQPHFTQV